MRLQFFSIPAHGDAAAVAELNAFVSTHRVRELERRFVDAGVDSFWAICVSFVDGEARPAVVAGARGSSKEAIDYRAVLNPPDFAAYAKLRELRKAMALRNGVPPYQVLTNDQLAHLVRKRVVTKQALDAVEGFGAARATKYGAELLAALPQVLAGLDGITAPTNDAPHPHKA